MEYFLQRIARSLTDEFGNKLHRHCLVFPSRRAGLYFLKYLASGISRPVWSPTIMTINELFRSSSPLHAAGNEILLFELYKIYRKLNPSAESFDEFYFWGDMLLNDFDDTDKYMVNASLLFRNIKDLKTIDQQFGGLSREQVEIIRQFWVNFSPDHPTNEKAGFISIWSILYEMYSEFRVSLRSKNLAYEGMIFRDLAEEPEKYAFPESKWDLIHFIGFNALNECEREVMRRYKNAGKARLYWDYDSSYLNDGKLNSAGFFLRENLKIFGNDMPPDWTFETMINSTQAKRRVIETSSDIAQVKLVGQLLRDIHGITEENGHDTAVILADENLLIPLMTSLPGDLGDINITMGYPLKQTLVYTLVKQLMDLQRTAAVNGPEVLFNFREVISLLKHPLIKEKMRGHYKQIIDEIIRGNIQLIPSSFFAGSDYLSLVFSKPETPLLLSDYFRMILSLQATGSTGEESEDITQLNIRNEYIYRVLLSLNKLEHVVSQPDIIFSTATYIRLLDRMLRMQSVPFSGEPLSGIQIMGILETRALDFKNLIILSANEGTLPAVSAGSSFIPVNLRDAFGLPSLNHQESVYAYHFYRLLERAENVIITYNSNSEGLRPGEMSRFLVQMKYNETLKPEFRDLGFEIRTHIPLQESIERTEEHVLQLSSLYLDKEKGRVLSPSAINTWLACRMKFYFQYVNHLREPEKVTSEVDPAMIGNILHEIIRNLYLEYRNQVLTKEIIDNILINKKLIQRTTDEVIRSKYNNGNYDIVSGNELIMREVIITYLHRILNTDKLLAPLTITHLEDSLSFKMSFSSNSSVVELSIGGKVDRIDEIRGIMRIVDYKTGTVADSVGFPGDLFAEDRKKDSDGWLQTLIYCEAFFSRNPGKRSRPSVYKIKKLSNSYINDCLRIKTDSGNDLIIDDYRIIREEFLDNLNKLVSTIFNKDEPFTMSESRAKCAYCPYRALCLR